MLHDPTRMYAVVQADLPAANGIIHIIDRPITGPPDDLPAPAPAPLPHPAEVSTLLNICRLYHDNNMNRNNNFVIYMSFFFSLGRSLQHWTSGRLWEKSPPSTASCHSLMWVKMILKYHRLILHFFFFLNCYFYFHLKHKGKNIWVV